MQASTPPVRQQRRRLPVKRIAAPDGAGLDAGGAHHGAVAVFVAHLVEGLVEVDHLLGVVKKVDLVPPAYEVAEAHPDEAHQEAAVVELFEHLLHAGNDDVVGGGTRYIRCGRGLIMSVWLIFGELIRSVNQSILIFTGSPKAIRTKCPPRNTHTLYHCPHFSLTKRVF